MKTAIHIIEARAKHHAALAALAAECGVVNANGFGLWRKLVPLDRRAQKAAEDLCNVPNFQDQYDTVKAETEAAVAKLFGGKLPRGFFVNGDPRGHALKLDEAERTIPEGMQKDWGGNGILAAEII